MSSERNIELMIFKAFVADEKSKLAQSIWRIEYEDFRLPHTIHLQTFKPLQNYLDQLKKTVSACGELYLMNWA